MEKSLPSLIAIVIAGIGVWLLAKSAFATPTKKLTPSTVPTSQTPVVTTPVVYVPTVSYTPQGQKVITPATGTAPVIPIPGVAPVQPVPVIVPIDAVSSPVGQIYVFNPNTNQYAWTSEGNLPNLVAGGWRIVTSETMTYEEALAKASATGGQVAWSSSQGYYVAPAGTYFGD